MKVLSLFSGVGGFDMGLENAGMKTVFQCEWDKHANSILYKHWPEVPKWDDVSTLTGKHILAHAPVVDVVAWGSPCQDLSVAGKRAGIEGARSGLFHEGIRIIKELQEESNGQYPRISIWENVVGALNSNGGADFGIILNEMAEAGAVAVEWSVLDAQYFGIPQRRRRVFVIAIFDPVLSERCPSPLLPISESLPGHLAKGKQARKSAATTLTESTGTDGGILGSEIVGSLNTSDAKMISTQYVNENKCIVEPYFAFDTQFGSNANVTENIAPTLKSSQQSPSVAYPIQDGRDIEKYQNGLGIAEAGSPAYTLDQTGAQAVAYGIQGNLIGRQDHNGPAGKGHTEEGDPMFTLTSTDIHAVAYDEYNDTTNDIHHALRAGTKQSTGVLEPTMAVRRLTPLECERLMGWPDGHTQYKADGTEQADSHRYKQAGNGVASPVAQWIAKHILAI